MTKKKLISIFGFKLYINEWYYSYTIGTDNSIFEKIIGGIYFYNKDKVKSWCEKALVERNNSIYFEKLISEENNNYKHTKFI